LSIQANSTDFFQPVFIKKARVFIRSKERSIRGSPQSGTAVLWGDVAAASSDLIYINIRPAVNYKKVSFCEFPVEFFKIF